MNAKIKVGIKAALNKSIAEIPLGKYLFNIDCPAGFGALAIIVSPPPVIAPATIMYLLASEKFSTKEAK